MSFWMSRLGQEYIANTLRAEPAWVRVADGGENALLLFFRRNLMPGMVLASSYPYAMVYGSQHLFWKNIDGVRRHFREQGIARFEMAISGKQLHYLEYETVRKHILKGTLSELKENRYVLDIEKFNNNIDLLAAYPGKLRWAVRKGLKSGVLVKQITRSDIETAHSLYLDTMREKGAPQYYSEDRFRYIAERLSVIDKGALLLAEVSGQAVGVAAVIDSENARHLVQLAVPREFRHLRISEVLVHEIISSGLCKSKKYLDFMATPVDDQGVSDFKKKWGAEEEPITHLVLSMSRLKSSFIHVGRRLSRHMALRLRRR